MRFPFPLAAAIAALAAPAAAEPPAEAAACETGDRPIRFYSNWSAKSDAICDYGFVEANHRLAGLLELPGGDASIDWLKHTMGIPHLVQREGFAPNGFFTINAGYQVALAGPDGWEMVIEAYQRRREGAWGRKDDFEVKFHGVGLSPQQETESRGRCLSEAAVLDRAIAAGWRYVPGAIESGTAGPIFMPGALVKDDGRRLVLIHLSRTTELPPRATLEATCAWIFSFAELHETGAGTPR
jgi:hypothetical protein